MGGFWSLSHVARYFAPSFYDWTTASRYIPISKFINNDSLRTFWDREEEEEEEEAVPMELVM